MNSNNSKSQAKPWEHAKAQEGSASDPLAARFVQSLTYDRRLYRHDIAGSLAHANMLRSVGLINARELQAIQTGLKTIQSQIDQQGAEWPGWKIELEDVHMCIESALIDMIGEPGRKLHTGRSRNDQVALDLKLWIEDAARTLDDHFDALLQAFLHLAQRQGLIIMPSYTHLQRAQPIVLGGEIVAWMEAFDRAARRMVTMRAVIPRNPLGSGAIAGSSLPLDRHLLAKSLPLGGPTASSIDATASRDSALDFVYSMAMTAMTLSRWAEQWIIYASSEFGFLKLDDRYTTGSSMMPQKRNPDMLELIRGRCGGIYGNLIALLTLCKGLPIGYNRDLQEDKRQVFAAYDTLVDCLAIAARIVVSARFDEQRIQESLQRGFLDATSLAEYLVTRGAPFRTAHQVVGGLVRLCESKNLDQLSQLTLADFNDGCKQAGLKADLCRQDVYQWLGAKQVVERYQTFGNAGVQGFQQQIKEWELQLQPKAANPVAPVKSAKSGKRTSAAASRKQK